MRFRAGVLAVFLIGLLALISLPAARAQSATPGENPPAPQNSESADPTDDAQGANETAPSEAASDPDEPADPPTKSDQDPDGEESRPDDAEPDVPNSQEPQGEPDGAKPAESDQQAEQEQQTEQGQQAEEDQAESPDDESADDEPGEDPPADTADGEGDDSTPGDDQSEPAEEGDETPPPATVEWNEKIEEVLTKRYPENADDLRVIEQQTQRVIEAATPATVSIQIGGAFGSGVIVSADGLVLTAGHVCGRPGRKAVFIFPDGSRVRGETLGVNRQIDSGMARITDPGPWPYMKMADAGKIENGEWVVAMGQPGGFDGDRTPPVRLGRVLFANEGVINTDCTLVGGDSGGPLFNMRGEVVGIHSRIGRSITNNFHVPISTYHATRERLLAAEIWGGRLGSSEPVRQRALLGISGNSLNGKAEITQVFRGMPAERAGIKVGDIVESLNGKKVESFDDFARRVLGSKPGSQVKIGIVRGDKPMEIEVRLAGNSKPLPGSPDVEPPAEEEES